MDVQALQIFGRCHVERNVEPLQQKAGGTDMVGMIMRGDDAGQRPPAQCPIEHQRPSELGRLIAKAGVQLLTVL